MKNFIGRIIFISLVIATSINSQTFDTTPLITMPGNNYDIDVIGGGSSFNYLCWVNQLDSFYAIEVKKNSSGVSDNIQIYSSGNEIANPKLAFIRNADNLRIIWQMKVNNHWQILTRELVNDTLTNIRSVTDSLSDNTSPSISSCHAAWINNGNILYQNLDSLYLKPKMLDSVNCSDLDLGRFDSPNDFSIIYEKGNDGEKQIYYTGYHSFNNSSWWYYDTISHRGNNINPHFSIAGIESYQTFQNGVWKAVSVGDTTNNLSYNCENPDGYAYPILAKQTSSYTPYFMVYDSDSLSGNKEIFFKPIIYHTDTTMDISNASGDDYSPHIAFYKPSDTLYMAIFWIHNENGKKDIWMAKTVYNPNFGEVDGSGNTIEDLNLEQNYPNPFNPATKIVYRLTKRSFITLKVYNILGNEIKTLVNGYKPAGEYTISFDATSLPSGVYFYQLRSGEFVLAKKMVVLK